MKARHDAIGALAALLRERKAQTGLGNGQIARLSGVDASQVSRVLAGKFRTLSHNAVQICKVLGIDAEDGSKAPAAKSEHAAKDEATLRLQERVLAVWDQTLADADRLAAFLDQLAALRRAGRRGGRL